MLHFNRLESAGCNALCDAARPAGTGQVSASTSGDARSEMAGSMLGGNVEVTRTENKITKRHWTSVNFKQECLMVV